MTSDAATAPATKVCPRCAGSHDLGPECPYVKAVDYAESGTGIITRIEFLVPADFGRASAPTDKPPREDYARLGEKK